MHSVLTIIQNGGGRIAYKATFYSLYRKYVEWCRQQGRLPWLYKRYLRKKCAAINAKEADVSFVFFSDAHWGANRKLSPSIVRYISESAPVSCVFSGGDVITFSDTSKTKMLELWRDFNASFGFLGNKFYHVYGNHDNNSHQQPNEVAIFSSDEVMSCQRIGDGIRFGSGFSFYVDDISSKTRFLCLDTGRQLWGEDDYTALCNNLRNAPPSWPIVVLTHIVVEWIDMKYQCRPYIERLLEMLDNHNTQNLSKVELILAGHVHNDYVTHSQGGIPIVTVGADAYDVACGKYKQSLKFFREQCVTVVQLNYKHSKCYGTRIGRGKDLLITMTK